VKLDLLKLDFAVMLETSCHFPDLYFGIWGYLVLVYLYSHLSEELVVMELDFHLMVFVLNLYYYFVHSQK